MAYARQRYSRWDGSQAGEYPDAQELFSRLAEDVFHGWDFESALRRLLSQGFKDQQGRRLPGLDRIVAKLRTERQERLERHNLEGIFSDVAERLDRIVTKERAALKSRLQEASGSPAEKLVRRTVEGRLGQLDDLEPEPSSTITGLQGYEFMDQGAEQDFRELLDELRRNLVESHFRELGQNLKQMGPQQIAEMRQMVAELNAMVARHLAGEDAGYRQFMDRWGQLFPDHPASIDAFLEQLQQRMSEMDSLMQSLSPDSARELIELFDAALGDEALQGELAQLAQMLSQIGQGGQGGQEPGGFPFSGGDELSFPAALEMMGELRRLEGMERAVRQAYSGQPLSPELQAELAEALGAETAAGIAQIQALLQRMEEGGQLQRGETGLEPTPSGIRQIGQKALKDIFRRLGHDQLGNHSLGRVGTGSDPGDETKLYEFGDPFRLDVESTLMNAVRRGQSVPPLRLSGDDFEVVRPDQTVQSSTVLMLDMSRSMPLRGYFYAAKKMALALDSLIRTQYPRDTLYVVGFSDYAREITAGALAQLSYDEYVYGTNIQHGLMMARRLLNRQRGGNRQVILVSDGEPTAHMEGSEAVFRYPPLPETFQKTLMEVRHCTRENIVINTFMLESNTYLVQFVKQITKLNRGRAFFVSPDRLGDYVLVDYVSSRHQQG